MCLPSNGSHMAPPHPPSVLSNHRGNLTILNAGTEGFAPLVVVAGGHSATIRCAHWDHEVGGVGHRVGGALWTVRIRSKNIAQLAPPEGPM